MASNHEESKVLDLGGYGVVVYPALENDPVNSNNESFHPRDYITKVFYRKEDYDDVLKKRSMLRKILGRQNEGSQFETYHKEWRGKNLPKNVLKKLSNERSIDSDQKENQNNSHTVFYPIRMKHLGHSYGYIRSHSGLLQEIRQCSIDYLVKGIRGLFQTVSKLSEKGYVHGDIHAHNIMIYHAGNFCEFYLIDYDLFESFSDAKKRYETQSILYGAPESYHLLLSSTQENKTEPLHFYANRLFHHNEYLKHVYGTLEEFKKRLMEVIDKNTNQSTVSLATFDSFLLCLVLLDLLYRLYPFLFTHHPSSDHLSEGDIKRLRRVQTELESGSILYKKNRKTATEIKERLDQILKGNGVNQEVKVNQKNVEKCKTSNCQIMGGKRKTRKGKRRHQDEKRYRNTMKRW
jgi:serine/threonine protein kinase